ncbi:surface antigen-domain-containing protein [Phlyctochytrium arcticum]|nr:surface antigen-domain-containing protein [Phlyctochytrium arcticum]
MEGHDFTLANKEAAKKEAEARRLTELVVTSQDRELRVNSIRIEGIDYTRRSIVENLVKPVLASQNLGDIISESREACHRLNRLGVFKDVRVTLDTPQDTYGTEGELVDVVVNVKEGPRLYARTGADVSNYDTSTNITARISNAFGGGETIEGHASYAVQPNVSLSESATPFASESGSYLQLLVSKPILPKPSFRRPNRADPDACIQLAAFNTNRNMLLYMSHEEAEKGATLRYKTMDPYKGTHEFSYTAAWRHVHNLTDIASWSIRRDAGHSLKSSVAHTFVRDHRDDPMLPSIGSLIKTRTELAGLGGNTKFAKTEAEGQYAYPLPHGFSLSASGRLGAILPLFGQQTRVNDRFSFGGPNTIRGFRQNGIGPMDKHDSIGGDSYWGAGLSLFSPLPYLVGKPIKGHAFINGGSLVSLNTQQSFAENARRLVATPSISTGVGLAVRFSILRLELNYCLPLTATTSDSFKRGFQFGIGVTYM